MKKNHFCRLKFKHLIYKSFIFITHLGNFTLNEILSQTNNLNVVWQKDIGGEGNDELYSIQQTSDLGYILGGWSGSGISGDKTENTIFYSIDYWVVKLNENGDIQWQNSIGGNKSDYLSMVKQTSDNGYILGGTTLSDISGDKTENRVGTNNSEDIWVIKLDATGNIQWQNNIGTGSEDRFSSIQQTFDGGYILGAYTNSGISGDKTDSSKGFKDFWIMKLDIDGNIIWQKTIGGNGDDLLAEIWQTKDGGFILGGSSTSTISGDKSEDNKGFHDMWVLKLDDFGNIIWQKTIGGSFYDGLSKIQETEDNGVILGGTSNSNISGDKTEDCFGLASDFWIVKLDNMGGIQWQNTIGSLTVDGVTAIKQTLDGGYIVGGRTDTYLLGGDKNESGEGLFDYWAVKLDAFGQIENQNIVGGSYHDYLNDMIQAHNGDFILAGTSSSGISGDKNEVNKGPYDYWIVKLGSEISNTQNYSCPDCFLDFTVYPNPANSDFTILSKATKPYSVKLHNNFGELIFMSAYGINTCMKIDSTELESGVYYLTLLTEGEKPIKVKVIIQH